MSFLFLLLLLLLFLLLLLLLFLLLLLSAVLSNSFQFYLFLYHPLLVPVPLLFPFYLGLSVPISAILPCPSCICGAENVGIFYLHMKRIYLEISFIRLDWTQPVVMPGIRLAFIVAVLLLDIEQPAIDIFLSPFCPHSVFSAFISDLQFFPDATRPIVIPKISSVS